MTENNAGDNQTKPATEDKGPSRTFKMTLAMAKEAASLVKKVVKIRGTPVAMAEIMEDAFCPEQALEIQKSRLEAVKKPAWKTKSV